MEKTLLLAPLSSEYITLLDTLSGFSGRIQAALKAGYQEKSLPATRRRVLEALKQEDPTAAGIIDEHLAKDLVKFKQDFGLTTVELTTEAASKITSSKSGEACTVAINDNATLEINAQDEEIVFIGGVPHKILAA